MWRKTIIQLTIDFFPYWTVAHIFQGANFSMPTPCSILSFITGRLQKTWERFEESYLRQGFEDFLTKYIGTIGSSESREVRSLQSSHVVSSITQVVYLFLFLFFVS